MRVGCTRHAQKMEHLLKEWGLLNKNVIHVSWIDKLFDKKI